MSSTAPDSDLPVPVAQPVTTAQAGPDPNGVARPISPARVEAARENSGVMVGTTPVPTPTTAGVEQEQYKTAFIKVYQDAGVIGVSMLTLLVLCVLLGWLAMRILKMYSALVTGQSDVEKLRSHAVEKLSGAVMIVGAKMDSVIAETRSDSAVLTSEMSAKTDIVSSRLEGLANGMGELCHRIELLEERSRSQLELLSGEIRKSGANR